ncbi:MAG TPA: hypothetical protein VG167_11830 [Verrucomicrobiae bacterium]|nr:hypothetical protein [Verrucomicrobiae bacterium]
MAVCLELPAAKVWAQAQPQPASPPPQEEEPLMPPGYPSLDAPWTAPAKQKKAKPVAPAAVEPAPSTPAPAPTPTPVAESAAPEPSAAAAPTQAAPPLQPRIRKSEVSVSGDFFLGQGNVTLPFGFSLANALNPLVPGGGLHGTVNKADRTSDYYGATISYSYGAAWFLDLAYAHGSSSGNVPVSLSSSSLFETLNSSFSINDDWYQAYIRYTFPSLRGKRLSAYLRAGISYVQARLTDAAPIPAFGVYSETDRTDDLLGNIGFGVFYSLYASRHVRLGVQVEGEGFYGRRSQNITESFVNDFGLVLSPVSINNDLYGGIGRGAVRFEYRLGHTGAFKLFADGGMQGRFDMISYPSGLGSFNEMLWGPYIKAGLRYAF